MKNWYIYYGKNELFTVTAASAAAAEAVARQRLPCRYYDEDTDSIRTVYIEDRIIARWSE
jgi:hypothetical protein